VKSLLQISVVSCGLLCVALAPAAAQAPAARRPAPRTAAAPSSVAVVDISLIFKQHDGFKQRMEQMKQQVQAVEDQLKARHQDFESRRQKLATFRAGSEEYKRGEEELARLQAQLQADTQLKRKEFLEQEARVYYEVYTEVSKEIEAFASSHGISLVLRFSADDIDPADRASVLQGVNRPVVFQRNLNITYDILERLQRRYAQQASRGSTTAPATPARRR
jgi:Skp family chaperone for outer membrane proteins